MFLITDNKDIVRDISSRRENLARGYTFPGYKEHDAPLDQAAGVMIGDTFKDGVLTKSQAIRDQLLEAQQNNKKIDDRIRQTAIDNLKADGELPPDFEV